MNNEIKPLLGFASLTIKEAWKKLGENGKGVLLIVDGGGALMGMITDGDVRRWILSDGELNHPVTAIFKTNPIVAMSSYSKKEISDLLLSHKIECIPIVDENQKVIGIRFWDELLLEEPRYVEKLNYPVVIMAGGKGNRLEPFTKVLPKPLIPVGDKPFVEHIMDKFNQFGMQQFYLSIFYKANLIRAYFKDHTMPYTMSFFEEVFPMGTIGALSLIKDKLNTSFFVSNCDILVHTNYADIAAYHKENKNDLTLVGSMKHYRIPYGILEIKNGGELEQIKEKPELDFLVSTGLYVMEPRILSLIRENQHMDITDLMGALKKEKYKIGVFPVGEHDWVDIGQMTEYKNTLKKFEIS